MRTVAIVAVILSLSFAFALVGGSSVGPQIFGQDGSAGEDIDQFREETADNASVGDEEGEGLSADLTSEDEPTVTGFIISGGSFVIRFVAAVALLPVTLMNLGFPSWFAIPLGGILQIVAMIGVLQFVTGREWM